MDWAGSQRRAANGIISVPTTALGVKE